MNGLDTVKIEHRNQDQRGEPRIEAAVVKDKSAVHCRGRGADNGTDKSRNNAPFPSVFACNGAKSGCKRQAVDVGLGRKRPGNVQSAHGTNAAGSHKQNGISQSDGSNVFGMLSVSREGQRGKRNANGGARKADALGQKRENLGQEEHQIEVCQNTKSVYTKVDKANGHTEFIGKIEAVPRAFQERAVIAEGAAVEQKAEQLTKSKEDDEKDIHKSPINVPKAFIIVGVLPYYRFGRHDAKRFVKEAVYKNTEHSQSEPRLVHIVTAVHSGGSGQERGNEKTRAKAEQNRHQNAYNVYVCPRNIDVDAKRIAEQKIADKGRKCRGEHCHVQIFAQGILCGKAVNDNADKGRPHIDKIKSVKAMGNNKNVRRKGGRRCARATDENKQIASKTAKSCIEQRACKTSYAEIVGNELGRACTNAEEIL